MYNSKNKLSRRLPLFEHYVGIPEDEECCKNDENTGDSQNIEGIKFNIDIKKDDIFEWIRQLKDEIKKYQQLIEKFEIFERVELPRLAKKMSKFLETYSQKIENYVAEANVYTTCCDICVDFHVTNNSEQRVDDGEMLASVNEVFDDPKPESKAQKGSSGSISMSFKF